MSLENSLVNAASDPGGFIAKIARIGFYLILFVIPVFVLINGAILAYLYFRASEEKKNSKYGIIVRDSNSFIIGIAIGVLLSSLFYGIITIIEGLNSIIGNEQESSTFDKKYIFRLVFYIICIIGLLSFLGYLEFVLTQRLTNNPDFTKEQRENEASFLRTLSIGISAAAIGVLLLITSYEIIAPIASQILPIIVSFIPGAGTIVALFAGSAVYYSVFSMIMSLMVFFFLVTFVLIVLLSFYFGSVAWVWVYLVVVAIAALITIFPYLLSSIVSIPITIVNLLMFFIPYIPIFLMMGLIMFIVIYYF